tara:strand:+ start:94 stop:483 length:390 start_codon:yes stop_codon:yes gene_type:complete
VRTQLALHAAHTCAHVSQELLVAELLFLNFESNSKGIYMYVNSVGNLGGGLETEAFAVLDTMNYIQPEVTRTLTLPPNLTLTLTIISHQAGGGDETPAPNPNPSPNPRPSPNPSPNPNPNPDSSPSLNS